MDPQQGDGTISRVDMKTNRLLATIAAGIQEQVEKLPSGRIRLATVFEVPMTRIDPASDTVAQQWVGPGGDSIRLGHGSVWLTDFAIAKVWRLTPNNHSHPIVEVCHWRQTFHQTRPSPVATRPTGPVSLPRSTGAFFSSSPVFCAGGLNFPARTSSIVAPSFGDSAPCPVQIAH